MIDKTDARLPRSPSFLIPPPSVLTENTSRQKRKTINCTLSRDSGIIGKNCRRGCVTFTAVFRFKFNVYRSFYRTALLPIYLYLRSENSRRCLNAAISPSSANAKPRLSHREILLYLRDHNFLFAPRAFPRVWLPGLLMRIFTPAHFLFVYPLLYPRTCSFSLRFAIKIRRRSKIARAAAGFSFGGISPSGPHARRVVTKLKLMPTS